VGGAKMARVALVVCLVGLLCVQVMGGFPVGVFGAGAVVEQNAGFNFIGYGDTRGYDLSSGVSPVHAGLVNLYLQEDPELVVHTGDMVKEGGNWSQWLDFNGSIQAVWAAGIPFYGAVGNHEKYGGDDDLSNYTTFFDFSSVVDTPDETELQYAFTYEGVHFVVLNTEDQIIGGLFDCSIEQMSWLSSYLADTTAEAFIVAVFHRPAWSIRLDRPDRWAEAEAVREEFHDLFVEYDVDLVLMGHDHYYYRTVRDGIYYVTTGGGGAPLAGINTSAPIWQAGDVAASEYHYCNIEVNSVDVTVTAYRSDHSLLDSFNIERPSILPPPIPIELLLISLCFIVIIVVVVVIIYWRRKK
jgi:predicted phosphodiesterase